MRASVSIYEDPSPQSKADVWTEDEDRRALYFAVGFMCLGIASTMGYAAYHYAGLAVAGQGLGSLISQLPHYSPTASRYL